MSCLQEKRGGKSDEPLQLFLCADGHQFSPCRRHKCTISPWKLKPDKRKKKKAKEIKGRPKEWELHCPTCLDCCYAPAVRKTDSRFEFRKNKKHNWCEVVRNGDMKSFKAIIKLSSNGSEYKKLKDGTQKIGRPTRGDKINIKAGSAHAGLQGEIVFVDVDKHNGQPFKVKFEDGKTCRYREDEVEHKGEVQYRTKWEKLSDSITEGQDIDFYFIPHATFDFPKTKSKGKVIRVNDSEISVEYTIHDLFNKTGTCSNIRTSYKLLTRHYLCKLNVCQLARRGPKCGCKVQDVIPPEMILLHNKLNQPLSPQLDGPTSAFLFRKAEEHSNNIMKLARELDRHIAAAPSENHSIIESWRKFHDKLHEHLDNVNPLRTRRRVQKRAMSSRSADFPIKRRRVVTNDLSSKFRSRDSKFELNRVFGGDRSNECFIIV